jgi:hypothetical protein
MDIPDTFEQTKKPGDKGYVLYLSQVLFRFWGRLAKVVNNGIELYTYKDQAGASGSPVNGNIKGYVWTGNLVSGANVINHPLKYVPLGFIVLSITTNDTLWRTGATTTTITVNSASPAGPVTLLII